MHLTGRRIVPSTELLLLCISFLNGLTCWIHYHFCKACKQQILVNIENGGTSCTPSILRIVMGRSDSLIGFIVFVETYLWVCLWEFLQGLTEEGGLILSMDDTIPQVGDPPALRRKQLSHIIHPCLYPPAPPSPSSSSSSSFLFLLLKFIFILCVLAFCLHVCICAICMWCRQRRVSNPLELATACLR